MSERDDGGPANGWRVERRSADSWVVIDPDGKERAGASDRIMAGQVMSILQKGGTAADVFASMVRP